VLIMSAHHMGANASEDSSGSTGSPARRTRTASNELTAPDDRVRKFQKTGDHGSRLRKTSASNAAPAPFAAAASTAASNARAGLPDHRPLGSQRRTAKVPLGPRGPPQDFSKHRCVVCSVYCAVHSAGLYAALAGRR
jgi:dual specificity tyrosine-phosphorylation-regulated kinase 2/3/4